MGPISPSVTSTWAGKACQRKTLPKSQLLSVCLSVCLSVSLSPLSLSSYLTNLSVFLSAYLSLSVCVYVCLSFCPSPRILWISLYLPLLITLFNQCLSLTHIPFLTLYLSLSLSTRISISISTAPPPLSHSVCLFHLVGDSKNILINKMIWTIHSSDRRLWLSFNNIFIIDYWML